MIIKTKGKFVLEHFSGNKLLNVYKFPNGVTTEGFNSRLDIMFNGVTSWYFGLINTVGFVAVDNADTMVSHTGWIEFTDYTETERVAWDSQTASNHEVVSGALSVFNVNADAILKGIFVTSDDVKSGSSGNLWATAVFPNDIPISDGDTFRLSYTVRDSEV